MIQPTPSPAWPTRLLAVGAIVATQALAFAYSQLFLVPALHRAGLASFWALSVVGGVTVLVVAPAAVLLVLRSLRHDAAYLSWRMVPAILGGDVLVTAGVLQLPTNVQQLQAVLCIALSVAAFIAVPLIATFIPRRVPSEPAAKPGQQPQRTPNECQR